MSRNRADNLTFKALQKAVSQDKLRLYLDYGKINRPGSPVYNPWECLLPVLIPVLAGLILIVSVGVIFGLFFIVAVIMIYSTNFKKKLHRVIIERTKGYLVSSYENCEKLWKFGGIVLVNADNKKLGCVSPDGDWKEFVIINYAELMLDEPKDKNQNEKQPPSDKQ